MRYTEKAGEISSLTCPPYDIISEEERLALLRENEYNIVRLELPKGEDPYGEAGRTLQSWESDGILRQDTNHGFYLYEEEFSAYGQTKVIKGIICLVKLEEFSKGIILPHEETLSKAKEDRLHLMKSTFCNFSSIYSLYPDPEHITRKRLDALSSGRPRYEFFDGSVTHRLWLVNDREVIQTICKDFADRKLYIADGHHRYETALNFRRWCREQGYAGSGPEYVMMMLADMEDEGLVVFPTHRLVRGLAHFDAEKLLSACAEYFDITERPSTGEIGTSLDALYRQGKKAFAYYGGGDKWDLLVLKNESVMAKVLPEKSDAYRNLDVSILHSLILERILGIDRENMAKQVNLTYTRSLDEALSSVRKGESQCAFLVNPTRVGEIAAVAAAGEKMPQKSTYFYPKLTTGLVFHKIEKEQPCF